MSATSPASGAVLVLGGGGFYGRYLVDDLLQHTAARVVVASRNPPRDHTWGNRQTAVPRTAYQTAAGNPAVAVCDVRDRERLEALMANADVVVHCAGPFQTLPLAPVEAALATGTAYVDIAEDRQFAREVRALATESQPAGSAILNGFSVAPGMEALFAAMVAPCLDSLTAIRTFAAPDTRKHRGRAMFHAMLIGVGRPFWQPRGGEPALVHGWTEPQWVRFPPPLGKRLTYLVLEMADLDLLPALFGVQTVEFKAGTEHAWLNRLLGLAARIRVQSGHPRWERYTALVRAFSWLVGRVGKDEGGVMFEISGLKNEQMLTYRLALVAEKDGGLIPAVLASIATQKLLEGSLAAKGLVAIHDWITPHELVGELQRRDLHLWWQAPEANGWQPFNLDELR